MFNVESWIERSISSVLTQNYNNFKYIMVDDCSTDRTVEIVKSLISENDKVVLRENTEKKFSLRSIYDGINALEPKDDDIILTLDGDDWFAHNNVLSVINDKYNKSDCWMTYGSYVEFPTGNRGIEASKYPISDIKENNFRKSKWRASHLRTFRYKLWKKIKEDDFLDWNGEFFRTSIDKVFMFPMLEMSGEKSHYVDDVLYVYNLGNPLNIHKVRRQLQFKSSHYLKENKKPYSRLDKL